MLSRFLINKIKYLRTTVRGKVAHAGISIFLMTVILLSSLNAYHSNIVLVDKQEALLQSEAEKYAENINSWIEKEKGIVESAAYAMSTYVDATYYDYQMIADQFYMEHSELKNVFVGFENGDNIQADRTIEVDEDYDPRVRGWYREAVEQGKSVVISPYQDIFSGEMCCTIATPIYNRGKIVAVVGADVEINTVVDLVEYICFDDDSYGFMLDDNGDVVAHKNPKYAPQDGVTVSMAEMVPGLKSIIDNPGSEIIKTVDYDGERRYFASAEIGEYGWLLCTAVSTDTIDVPLRKMVFWSIFIALVFAIGGILYLLRKTNKLLKPIEEIAPAMERLANGDFSTWVDFTDQQDEIGMLQNSMSIMVGTLSDIVRQQKFILGQISNGNLMVQDMDELPGEFNEIAKSVNDIKITLLEVIRDIQFSAINLQGTAMGFTAGGNPDEMQAVFDELSAEATDMMNKANMFRTSEEE